MGRSTSTRRLRAARYGSGQRAHCFGWTDASDDSPEELATKFIDRYAELCASGHGPDEAYAHWYVEMLEATEPDGLIYSYADWEMPIDQLPFLGGAADVRCRYLLPAKQAIKPISRAMAEQSLNGLAQFRDGTPHSKANVYAARREPRTPGIAKTGSGRQKQAVNTISFAD